MGEVNPSTPKDILSAGEFDQRTPHAVPWLSSPSLCQSADSGLVNAYAICDGALRPSLS
ncbi:hypothetical protein ABIC63_005625 [Pseudacidovorax sp. 1753]